MILKRAYGDEEAKRRAAAWAARGGYRLSQTSYNCAHGLLRKGRPYHFCGCLTDHFDALDHAQVWLRNGRPHVLLAHPYPHPDAEATALAAHQYADKFGLIAVVGDPDDAWYGYGTIPIRYTTR